MGRNERELLDAMQFVKVSVMADNQGDKTNSGYLTETSCLMMLIELHRSGFVVARPVTPLSSDKRQDQP